MAQRRLFGGGLIQDFAVEDPGDGSVAFAGGAVVLFWNARTGGTRYTDLSTDLAGTLPVTASATSDGTDGYDIGSILPVYGPGDISAMWAEVDGGARVLVWTIELADMVDDVTAMATTTAAALATHAGSANGHGTGIGDLTDVSVLPAASRGDGYVLGWSSADAAIKLLPPSVSSGAVLLNPPLVGGVSQAQLVTPPTGTSSGDPWLDVWLPYSASDNNPDFWQIHAYWSDLATKLKTAWFNGNGEFRTAPSTPGRIGARFFESYEGVGAVNVGASTGPFAVFATNPKNSALRENLLAIYGSASSQYPGWTISTRVMWAQLGVQVGGQYNGLTAFNLRGRRATTGAPTTGTWVAGDVVADSAFDLYLCTVSGTPGTWIGTPTAPETWTDFPSLGTNVTQGTPHAQYRLRGDVVELRGQLAYSGAVGTLSTLPTGRRPPGAVVISSRVGGASAANNFVNISALGVITTSSAGINAQTQNFDGMSFSVTP
jgi:hypothetical protein